MPLTPITTVITWHPGGAQRDSNGEPVPWPWGEAESSPMLIAVFTWSRDQAHESRAHISLWNDLVAYVVRSDLEPPKWGG